MKVFFDRCFGKRLPEALKNLKPPFEVIGYFDRYTEQHNGPALPDDIWLGDAGKAGWIVITLDDKWHHEASHVEAIQQHRVGCFVLSGAQDPNWLRARLVLEALPDILTKSETVPRPFLFRVDKNGRVTPKYVISTGTPRASGGPVA